MKKVKYLIIAIIMMGLFMINTKAASYEKVGMNKTVPSEYAFTPKFIKGENGTKVTVNNGVAINCDNRCSTTNDYLIMEGDDYSDIFVLYENVGSYYGKQVDLRISFNNIAYDDRGYAEYRFAESEIGISLSRVSHAEFNFEYLDHGTGENLNIKSVISYSDIDGVSKYEAENNTKTGEVIGIENSSADYIYVYDPYGFEHFDKREENGFTYLTGTYRWTGICGNLIGQYEDGSDHYQHDGDSDCGGLGNGTFVGGYDGQGNNLSVEDATANATNFYNAGIATVLYNSSPFVVSWKSYYLGISRAGFLDIEEQSPVIYTDTESKISDEIIYEIIQSVPNVEDIWYYRSWSIEIDLSDKLDADVNDVVIFNNGGEDVTDLFDLSIVDNKLIINAKEDTLNLPDFYNNTYGIIFKAKPNENAQVGDVITTKAVHLTTSASGESRRLESDEISINLVPDDTSNVVIEDNTDNSSVSVPSTAATISIFIYIIGAIVTVLGIVLYVVTSKKLKKQRSE